MHRDVRNALSIFFLRWFQDLGIVFKWTGLTSFFQSVRRLIETLLKIKKQLLPILLILLIRHQQELQSCTCLYTSLNAYTCLYNCKQGSHEQGICSKAINLRFVLISRLKSSVHGKCRWTWGGVLRYKCVLISWLWVQRVHCNRYQLSINSNANRPMRYENNFLKWGVPN